jgi:hypothetical protein
VVTGKKLSTLLGQVAVLKASPKVPKSPEIGRIIPLDLDGQTLPTCLATFSHHKRDGHQRNIQPSTETRLEEVMTFIRTAET